MMSLIIRPATSKDLNAIYMIESLCFPSKEAASFESLQDRILTFPEGFLIGEFDDCIIGFINGAATNQPTIEDNFFKSMKHHELLGDHLAVFGLDVHPEHQKKDMQGNLCLPTFNMPKRLKENLLF